MVKEYDGDLEKLGNAERFYHELIKVPKFQVRIEGMIQVSMAVYWYWNHCI